ncbi:hypothetical protein AB0M39_16975 [Streptomyces sp. NPDC051907]|uniref:hypothetical protein n=1 Tax=Streptomyces sp. NPDC051907 TaxID=3155284 RepID=UPI00342F49D8
MAEDATSGRKAPPLQETDFFSKTHDELLDMLEGTKAESAAELAKKLSKAASMITRVGDGLKTHMTRVVWEGEGAKAFRDWGHDAAMATLELGRYSEQASSFLEEVAVAIAGANSAIPKKDGKLETQESEARAVLKAASNDRGAGDMSDTHKQLEAALQQKEERRNAAAHELRRLAGTYRNSGEKIMALHPPEFPPPPGQFVPPPMAERVSNTQYVGQTGTRGRTSQSVATADAYVSPPSSREDTAKPTELVPGDSRRTVQPALDRPVDMEIDSVDTLPDPRTTAPPSAPPNLPPVGRPEGPVMPTPGPIPPTFGGKQGLPNTNPPVGRIPGPGLRGPIGPGPGPAPIGPGGSRMPREGISGGKSVPPTSRPTVGLPRTPVIGEGQTARTGPVGRGMPGLPGTGPVGPGQTGITGGRRLASETGGVVGGRAQPGGQNIARPFTPGGSGLVRGTSQGASGPGQTGQAGRVGAMPHGAGGANPRRDERDGQRPDYLSEDEETWQQGQRRVVPPVID